MSVSQATLDIVEESVESTELATRNGFHLEPRCRVCRNDLVRKKVNAMLACGGSYAQIVRALGEDNAHLDKRDQVTVDSVRTHTTKHFPVQKTAHATYREILERRARENQVDFVEGVAIALTPMAFYEVAMTKAFRTLVDDGIEVSVETGLRAAEKLQSVLDGRERGSDDPRAEGPAGPDPRGGQIHGATGVVGGDHREDRGAGAAPGGARRRHDSFDDDDDPYDPTEFIDEDDEEF